MSASSQLILSLILTLGEYPYYQIVNNKDICTEVVNGLTLDIPEHCPKSIRNVMISSWKYFPMKRCSFEDIVSIIVKGCEISPRLDFFYEIACLTSLRLKGLSQK